MNFPRFWARGEWGNFICWRWSSNSVAEAKALAAEAAQKLAERYEAGTLDRRCGTYYPDRPFREPVLQEIKDSAGETAAVITRNSYGCLVLNTARVMFVDVDFPERRVFSGFFARLFGKGSPETSDPLVAAMARVESWTLAHSEWGWRAYRTRAGLRLLCTQGLHDADGPQTGEVFLALGADELYSKLCKNQKCFRARLTPKPWRCGFTRKPARWPWETSDAEQRFHQWDAEYRKQSEGWATCKFLRQIGNPAIHTEIKAILHIHDEMCRVDSSLELA